MGHSDSAAVETCSARAATHVADSDASLARAHPHHHLSITKRQPVNELFYVNPLLINISNPTFSRHTAFKAEDDLFSNGPQIQLRASNSYTTNQQTADNASAMADSVEGFSDRLPGSLRRSIYDNAFEDDNDSEMASLDGVSDAEPNDNSINSLQNAGSNNFARTFFNNTRRRMSSGLVLSYNFLKGATSGKRRDST